MRLLIFRILRVGPEDVPQVGQASDVELPHDAVGIAVEQVVVDPC